MHLQERESVLAIFTVKDILLEKEMQFVRIRENAKEKDSKILHHEWLFKHIPGMTLK